MTKQNNNTFIFEQIQPFNGKYACVKYCEKWGVIEDNGEWKIKPHYRFMKSYSSELFIAQENNLYGIIDIDRSIVIPFKYESLSFINSKNLLIAQLEEKFGIINTQGDIILSLNYEEVSEQSNDKIFAVNKSGKWGILNSDNKLLIPFEYDNIELGKDFFIAEKEENFGLADYSNNVLIPFIYKKLNPFEQGMDITCLSIKENLTFIAQRSNKNFIIIDSENKRVSKQVFENVTEIGTTLYSANIDNKTCAIDRFGNIKIPLDKFYTIFCFYKLSTGEIVSLVEDDNSNEALINGNGEIIIPFEVGYRCHGFMYTMGKYILMRKDGKFGVIDQNNNVRIPFLYDWIFLEDEGYSGVNIGKKWGYININGQSLHIKNHE